MDGHRGTLALVDPPPPASTSKNRRGLWSFASGSAFGALVCVILVSWLTTSEQPRAEPFVRGPQPVSPAPAPVSPAAPAAAEPVVLVSTEHHEPAPSSPTDAKKESFVGSLRIDSAPQGARVFIDRTPAGVTPLVARDLSAGSHAVRVEADGYLPWSSAIRVVADRQTRVHTTLDSALVRR
jgi:hypothetical protein